jgi:hypothetical protein
VLETISAFQSTLLRGYVSRQLLQPVVAISGYLYNSLKFCHIEKIAPGKPGNAGNLGLDVLGQPFFHSIAMFAVHLPPGDHPAAGSRPKPFLMIMKLEI